MARAVTRRCTWLPRPDSWMLWSCYWPSRLMSSWPATMAARPCSRRRHVPTIRLSNCWSSTALKHSLTTGYCTALLSLPTDTSRMSVYLSVRPIILPLHAAVAGLLLWALQPGDIDQLLYSKCTQQQM